MLPARMNVQSEHGTSGNGYYRGVDHVATGSCARERPYSFTSISKYQPPTVVRFEPAGPCREVPRRRVPIIRKRMSGRERRERKTSSKLAWLKEQDEQFMENKKKAKARPKKKKAKPKPEPKKVIVIHKSAGSKVKLPKLNKSLSAYQLFSKAIAPRTQEDYPDATLGERSKIVSEVRGAAPRQNASVSRPLH